MGGGREGLGGGRGRRERLKEGKGKSGKPYIKINQILEISLR